MGTEVSGKVKGVPMRVALESALDSYGLGYCVQDGFLMIDTSIDVVKRRLDSVEKKIDRILSVLEAAKPEE